MSVLLLVGFVPGLFVFLCHVGQCLVVQSPLCSLSLSLHNLLLFFFLFKTGWLRMYVSMPMPRAVLLSTFRDLYTC